MIKTKLHITILFAVVLISATACSDDIVKFPDHTQDPGNVVSVNVPEGGITVEGGSSFKKVFSITNGPASEVSSEGAPGWFSMELDSVGVKLTVSTAPGKVVPDSLQGETLDVSFEAYSDDNHVGGSILKITVN